MSRAGLYRLGDRVVRRRGAGRWIPGRITSATLTITGPLYVVGLDDGRSLSVREDELRLDVRHAPPAERETDVDARALELFRIGRELLEALAIEEAVSAGLTPHDWRLELDEPTRIAFRRTALVRLPTTGDPDQALVLLGWLARGRRIAEDPPSRPPDQTPAPPARRDEEAAGEAEEVESRGSEFRAPALRPEVRRQLPENDPRRNWTPPARL